MFFTADQLVAHAVGDYVLQSHWMASEKTSRSVACLAHVATYVLPFLLLTRDPRALAFIAVTHFVIDRWRLARFVCWAKNWMAPKRHLASPVLTATNPPRRRNWPWRECTATGYGPPVQSISGIETGPPVWMATWLMIVVDNLMHVTCNALALWWWP